jgi:hypothetical protein
MRVGLFSAAVLMLLLAPLAAFCEHGEEGHIEVLGFCHARTPAAESAPARAIPHAGSIMPVPIHHSDLFETDLHGSPRSPGLPSLSPASLVSDEFLSPWAECAAPSGREASGPSGPGISLLHCTLLL